MQQHINALASASALSVTAEEAVRLVPHVVVPTTTYLRWVATVAPVPAHVAGHVWVSMTEHLEAAIRAAAEASGREMPSANTPSREGRPS